VRFTMVNTKKTSQSLAPEKQNAWNLEVVTKPVIGPSAFQVLLENLEVHGVRFYAARANEQCYQNPLLLIHPKDTEDLVAVCRELKQVRLVRRLGAESTFQIILQDIHEGAREYSAVNVLLESCLRETALHPLEGSTASPERRSSGSNRRPTPGWVRSQMRLTRLRAEAWLRPNGLFCVMLGPDGVGKSTTIESLQRELEDLFGPCNKRRWRPGVIRKVAPDTLNRMPHAKSQRGWLTSTLFVLGLAVDFSIGYAAIARPAMARSETVIFDRYYHDLLIDPRRYRYSGPRWLPHLIARFIPPREALFIILDANPEVILRRKQELPMLELERQRSAYRAFSERARNSIIVNTERPVKEIVAVIVDAILVVLASRNAVAR
jgi:thymidylate kinase